MYIKQIINKQSKIILISAAALLLLLFSCGTTASTSSGDNGTGGTGVVSGIVADGPLTGATVFLDCNTNFMLDASGEPSTTSTTGGKYSIPTASADQAASCPLVVDATDTSTVRDEDDETATGSKPTLADAGRNGFKISSPAGKHEFVSPFSSISHGIEGDEDKILDYLGITGADLTALGITSREEFFTFNFIEARNNPAISNIAYKIAKKARMFAYMMSSEQSKYDKPDGTHCEGEECLEKMVDMVVVFTNMEEKMNNEMMEDNHKGMPTFRATKSYADIDNEFVNSIGGRDLSSILAKKDFPGQSLTDRFTQRFRGGLWVRKDSDTADPTYCGEADENTGIRYGNTNVRFLFVEEYAGGPDVELLVYLPSAHHIHKDWRHVDENNQPITTFPICEESFFTTNNAFKYVNSETGEHLFSAAANGAAEGFKIRNDANLSNQIRYHYTISSDDATTFNIRGNRLATDTNIPVSLDTTKLTFTISGATATAAGIAGKYYYLTKIYTPIPIVNVH